MSGPDQGAERAFVEALEGVIAALRIEVDESTRERLLDHYRRLMQWNRRMSLTTIREPAEIATRHFGESLFLARELPLTAGSVLDVGSGAGFPGLPLAAWRSGLKVDLLEAVQRKAVFLREVSRTWSNVVVRNERLERLEGSWDASVMRAVAVDLALPELARVSDQTAILTGEEGAEQARKSGLFEWKTPIPLPWGARRLLLMGRRVRP